MVGMLVRRLAASETFQLLFKILIRFGFSNDDAVGALLRFALFLLLGRRRFVRRSCAVTRLSKVCVWSCEGMDASHCVIC